MNKTNEKFLVRIFLFVVLFYSCLIASCSSSGSNAESQSFYYYPERNIYLDKENNNYYYSLDGGDNWKTFSNSDNNVPEVLGKSIKLHRSDSDLSQLNKVHREKYSGVLYNILQTENDTAVTDVVKEKRTSAKTKAGIRPAEKPKSGFKKLIDNIFGKGKKKDK